MPKEQRIAVAGSERNPLADARSTGPVPGQEVIHATVILRRRTNNPVMPQDPDLQAVEDFALEHGLTVSERDAGRRCIGVAGTAQAIQTAFSAHPKWDACTGLGSPTASRS